MLDELLASGEVMWSGGGLDLRQRRLGRFPLRRYRAADAGHAGSEIEFTATHRAILDMLAGGGAFFFRQLAQDGIGEAELKAALWELIWAGWVTGDTFAPVRAMLSGAPGARKRSAPAHRQGRGKRPPRLSRYSVAHPQARAGRPDRGRPLVGAADTRARFHRCGPTTKRSCC